ncbi:MAG TPA: type II toxin-antitoxin system VapC family toxin [Thermomicrobiales bacterium]|nr:type II toxin-antitoxin system VapC family toxin [Thermomicrobiales bacterium]
MRFVLDTNVLSQLLTTGGDTHVKDYVRRKPSADIFVSVVSIGEIRKGVSLLPEGRRRNELEGWFLQIQSEFRSRVLPIDLETAVTWGELSAGMRRARPRCGGPAHCRDALQHGLTVMTRNIRDSAPTGVELINAWPTEP